MGLLRPRVAFRFFLTFTRQSKWWLETFPVAFVATCVSTEHIFSIPICLGEGRGEGVECKQNERVDPCPRMTPVGSERLHTHSARKSGRAFPLCRRSEPKFCQERERAGGKLIGPHFLLLEGPQRPPAGPPARRGHTQACRSGFFPPALPFSVRAQLFVSSC